ncbi:prostaglandin G/H synthase 1 isoform X1 [Dromaius novaehollandiae]|uniref:prostaglandin G/H synthase 1 isoform X1 n=1 Tax=Dromaius novaehollandiae TaxID=8790 RepID=UPI0031200CF9
MASEPVPKFQRNPKQIWRLRSRGLRKGSSRVGDAARLGRLPGPSRAPGPLSCSRSRSCFPGTGKVLSLAAGAERGAGGGGSAAGRRGGSAPPAPCPAAQPSGPLLPLPLPAPGRVRAARPRRLRVRLHADGLLRRQLHRTRALDLAPRPAEAQPGRLPLRPHPLQVALGHHQRHLHPGHAHAAGADRPRQPHPQPAHLQLCLRLRQLGGLRQRQLLHPRAAARAPRLPHAHGHQREEAAPRRSAAGRAVPAAADVRSRPAGHQPDVRLLRPALHPPVLQDLRQDGPRLHQGAGPRGGPRAPLRGQPAAAAPAAALQGREAQVPGGGGRGVPPDGCRRSRCHGLPARPAGGAAAGHGAGGVRAAARALPLRHALAARAQPRLRRPQAGASHVERRAALPDRSPHPHRGDHQDRDRGLRPAPQRGEEYSYEQFLYNTSMLTDYGVEALVESFSKQVAGRIGGGQTINGHVLQVAVGVIEESRQLRLQPFNEYRKRFGLRPYESFQELTGEDEKAAELQELYGDIDALEFYVGLLLEKPQPNSLFGESMVEIGAPFSLKGLLGNPICSPEYWKPSTFGGATGFEIVKTASLEKLVCLNVKKCPYVSFRVPDSGEAGATGSHRGGGPAAEL